MSHYDLAVIVEEVLDNLNGFSLGVLAALSILYELSLLWHAWVVIGQFMRVLLWIVVHAA